MEVKTGITLNKEEIRNEFGYKCKYSNSLEKGTEIWIHYGKNGHISSIEPLIHEEFLGEGGTDG